MGAAYDRDGNVLGEMQADTMREVFDGLQKMHPEAHEVRIRREMQEAADAKVREASAKLAELGRDRMLQFFTYSHLPEHLAKVSLPFCQLAEEICATLPSNPERTVALRKLLEAKDCAVRALLFK